MESARRVNPSAIETTTTTRQAAFMAVDFIVSRTPPGCHTSESSMTPTEATSSASSTGTGILAALILSNRLATMTPSQNIRQKRSGK